MKNEYSPSQLVLEIIEPLQLKGAKALRLMSDLEWGLRFTRTHEEVDKLVEIFKTINKKKAVSKKIDDAWIKISKLAKEELAKTDTKWDITWNSNPENVLKFIQNWSFDNVFFYWDKSKEITIPFLGFSLDDIIWIQSGLRSIKTNLIANEICALIKNIDTWLSTEWEVETFQVEVMRRIDDIELILLAEHGQTMIDLHNELLEEAYRRQNEIDISTWKQRLLDSMIAKEAALDLAIANELMVEEAKQRNDELTLSPRRDKLISLYGKSLATISEQVTDFEKRINAILSRERAVKETIK